jgi:hypothetical protein
MQQLFAGYNIRWRNPSCYQGRVLSDLVNKYRNWVQQTLVKYREMPFGFTEWTVTGHLAVAAGRLGYYVLQEYSIERKMRDGKGPKRPRPDLYLRTSRHDYVLEVKQVWLELGCSKSATKTTLDKALCQARDKLYRYLREAEYRCSIVVAPVYIKITDWERRYHTLNSYSQAKAELRDNLDSALRELPSSVANYWGGFLCTHQEAKNEYEKARNERWGDPIVGFVVSGRIIPPGHRGR